jgi:hypothetical protein
MPSKKNETLAKRATGPKIAGIEVRKRLRVSFFGTSQLGVAIAGGQKTRIADRKGKNWCKPHLKEN